MPINSNRLTDEGPPPQEEHSGRDVQVIGPKAGREEEVEPKPVRDQVIGPKILGSREEPVKPK